MFITYRGSGSKCHVELLAQGLLLRSIDTTYNALTVEVETAGLSLQTSRFNFNHQGVGDG